jgi:hypothetical protein
LAHSPSGHLSARPPGFHLARRPTPSSSPLCTGRSSVSTRRPPPPAVPYYPPPAATGYYQPGPPAPMNSTPVWDCTALIAALNNTSAGSSNNGSWVMDHGATSHMVSDPGILSSPTPVSTPSHVTVGNGVSLPKSTTGHTTLSTPQHTFQLNNVLVVPSIIINLLSTR